jgi:hypothetical protein
VFYTYLDEAQTWFATRGKRKRSATGSQLSPEPASD